MNIADKVFALSASIRYVALYQSGRLDSRQRDSITAASSSESDKYEELFVNPVLLKLAEQRGTLDCGGARFVVVGYGNFQQLIVGLPDGHVSVCSELAANPLEFADRIMVLASGARL